MFMRFVNTDKRFLLPEVERVVKNSYLTVTRTSVPCLIGTALAGNEAKRQLPWERQSASERAPQTDGLDQGRKEPPTKFQPNKPDTPAAYLSVTLR
ncbi:hypothetical protein MHYP_G00354190 [Metynnis hypsauchen]